MLLKKKELEKPKQEEIQEEPETQEIEKTRNIKVVRAENMPTQRINVLVNPETQEETEVLTIEEALEEILTILRSA